MNGQDTLPGVDPGPADPDAERERLARAALCRLVEPGDAVFGRAVRAHGAIRLLHALRSGGPLPTELARRDPAAYRVRLGTGDPTADLTRIARLGGSFEIVSPEGGGTVLTWSVPL